MTSKRIGLVTGGLLAGALLLGTAGLIAAQDPTTTPTPSPTTVGPGGMMGGQMGTMTAEQLEQMNALHDQMVESGICDPAQMQALHSELNADR